MLYLTVRKVPYLRKNFSKRFAGWGNKKVDLFSDQLNTSDSILDIGCGSGLVAYTLSNNGFDVRSVDVSNCSLIPQISPEVYDGKRLPYADKSFDVALLLTVLHHCNHPEQVLSEALRVSHKVIVVEDTYNNVFQKYMTYLLDSFVNLGTSSMTYQNKNHQEWIETFQKAGGIVSFERQRNQVVLLKQSIFIVESKLGDA